MKCASANLYRARSTHRKTCYSHQSLPESTLRTQKSAPFTAKKKAGQEYAASLGQFRFRVCRFHHYSSIALSGSQYRVPLQRTCAQSTDRRILSVRSSQKKSLNSNKSTTTSLLSMISLRFRRHFSWDSPQKYDLLVIGGGSGGLAAAREAKRIAPTSRVGIVEGSKRMGGTCVNVGCIPKKLFHHSAMIKDSFEDAAAFGWEVGSSRPVHNYNTLVENVQMYIRSLNFGYRSNLMKEEIDFFMQGHAELVDHDRVRVITKAREAIIKADNIIIATGGRPNSLNIPGVEHTFNSDGLFSFTQKDLGSPPANGAQRRILIAGGGYIALETAGFFHSFGFDTTVLTRRNVYLSAMDQQMAALTVAHMENSGIAFKTGVTLSQIEKTSGGQLKVSLSSEKDSTSSLEEGVWDHVFLALGRTANTESLNLDKVGVKVNAKTRKVVVGPDDATSVPNIFAIGDCACPSNRELAPTAIKSGKMLARRLFGGATAIPDYRYLPTTVFTPLEYSHCGLSEETAIANLGVDNTEVYHSFFQPLEWTLPGRSANACYLKIICDKSKDLKIEGLHILGPNAGEMMQGFAVAVHNGLTYPNLVAATPMHPVTAEEVLQSDITKASGKDPQRTGC